MTYEELLIENDKLKKQLSEKKAIEDSLIESEHFLKTIIENYPGSYILTIEKDMTVGYSAGQEFKQQNLNPHDFIGQTLKQFFGIHEPKVRQNCEATFKGLEKSFELFIENQHRLYRTVPLLDKQNTVSRILIVTENITEKKKVEEQIQLQASLIDQVKNSVITIDFDNKILSWNKHAEYLYQWKEEEVLGKDIIDLLSAEKLKEKTLKNFEHLNRDGHWEGNYNVKRKDGTFIPAHIINTYLKDQNGKKIGFIGFSTDITDQLQAEKKIKESLLTFAQAEKIAKIGSWKLDTATMEATWSAGMYELFEVDKNQGKNLWETAADRIHPDYKQHTLDITNKAIEAKQPYELEYRIVKPNKKESTILMRGNPIFNDEDDLVSYAGVVGDITDRKKSQSELKTARIEAEESEKRFLLASKSAQLGIWDWDVKDNILIWDDRMFELYGHDKKTLENTYELWASGLHPNDKERAIAEVNNALEGIKDFDTTFRVLHPNGKVLHIKGNALVLRDTEGNATRMIGINRDVTEAKIKETELIKAKIKAEESEQRLKLATNAAQLGVWDWDINNSIVTWDDKTYELFGQNKETTESTYDLWVHALHPDDKERTIEEVNAALNGSKEYNAIFRVIHPNGNVLLINGYGLVLRDTEGNATRMIGINRDVTEAKTKEIELKKSKEEAERIAIELKESQKVANLGSWYLNIMTDEVIWSDELYGMYGFDPSLPPPPYTEHMKLFTTESWNTLSQELSKTKETGIPYGLELETIRNDNSNGWMWAKGEAVFDKNKQIIGLRGIAQDITERKQLELELIKAKEKTEESEKLLKKIAENFPNSYLSVIEKDFTIGFTSGQEFIKQGIEPNNFVGLKLDQVFGEKANEIIQSYQRTFKGEETKFELYFGDQYQRYRTVPLHNEKGEISRILAVSENITEEKNKELELQKAKEKAEESDRLKTEFINNMSHEIRTPMNGILGFSNMLNDKDLNPEKRKFYTSIIQNSGNQLMRVIDDILEISKLGTKQVKVLEEQICLNDLLLEHFSVFDFKAKENKTPLYLKKGLSDSDSTIFTDKAKLNKILSNLLENAMKYTHEGFIEFGYQVKNQIIELYVKDSGIGIKKDMHEKIFDRFSQEEKELSKNVGGLGLGLSIAKENAELLSGTITLDSEKGKGSIFFVKIPYKKAILNTMEDHPNNPEENIGQNIYTILVAEDEEINYFYLEVLLGKEPELEIKVLHAKNGEEAVEICRENTQICLVLMDLKMPIMSGYEATQKIKEIRPELPIVAQTAYTRTEDKEKAFTAGCNDFISKPISKETLSGVLNKYLETNK